MKELKIRYGLGEIYEITRDYLLDQMADVNKELRRTILQANNLEKLISIANESLNKLSAVWRSCDLEHKKRMQRMLFPEGIYYSREKNELLAPIGSEFLIYREREIL